MSPPNPRLELLEQPIDAGLGRPIKVICIGAGLNGILGAVLLPRRVKDVELVIYEKNEDVGGTWFENRYPGVACDIPAHSYQATFEPNMNWSHYYADGDEIQRYWRSVAEKYNCMQYIRLSHSVTEAEWDEASAKWKVRVYDEKTQREIDDEADILISATGFLNNWKWPDIPGREDYKGHLVHSANWKGDLELTNKEIAVIGSGSSAIQIVPALQKRVKLFQNYVRGKAWIATPFATLDAWNADGSNVAFTDENKKHWAENPADYHAFRRRLEIEVNSTHEVTQLGSEMQRDAVGAFTANMKNKLAKKPEILSSLIPDFPVACRRLTPGPGYLEALVADNVNFIDTPIKRFTSHGIETVDGIVRNVDAVICATGFDTSGKSRFPILGRGGLELNERWKDFPEAYLSHSVNGFPNLWFQAGPNIAVGSGSLTLVFEKVWDYIIAGILKVQRENIRTMEVSSAAMRDWSDYVESYFTRTVYGSKCRSWYKNGKEEGRITALWPGSCLHCYKAQQFPRWEDYQYTYQGTVANRLRFLGNGWTSVEEAKGNTAFYLDEIDYPSVDKPAAAR